MPRLSERATIDGKPVYKDRNGDLRTETNGFQHLCGLTEEEEKRLLQTLKKEEQWLKRRDTNVQRNV